MIMYRSFAEYNGVVWPPDVALKICYANHWRSVTWADVMARRRARQAEIIRQIYENRYDSVTEPAYVWTFKVPGFFYGGWHCYVVTRGRRFEVKLHHFGGAPLALSIMHAVPCGLLPCLDFWQEWMKAFARRHPRPPVRDPRPAGSIVGWLTRGWTFSLQRPEDVRAVEVPA